MTRKLLLKKICYGNCVYDCVVYGSCDCDYCEVKLNELLDEYDKHVLEQYKADTNLKDTIKDIHDNVAHEMYCKGIDDFAEKIKSLIYKWFEKGVINTSPIDKIAQELKAGEMPEFLKKKMNVPYKETTKDEK